MALPMNTVRMQCSVMLDAADIARMPLAQAKAIINGIGQCVAAANQHRKGIMMRSLTEQEILELKTKADELCRLIGANGESRHCSGFVEMEGEYVARLDLKLFKRSELDDLAAKAFGK